MRRTTSATHSCYAHDLDLSASALERQVYGVLGLLNWLILGIQKPWTLQRTSKGYHVPKAGSQPGAGPWNVTEDN